MSSVFTPRVFHFFVYRREIKKELEKQGGKISNVLPGFRNPNYTEYTEFYVLSYTFHCYPSGCMTKSSECGCRNPLQSILNGHENCLQHFVSKILETKDEKLSINAKTLSVSLNLITDKWRRASIKYTTTLLHFACLTGRIECVKYLLSLDRHSLKSDQRHLNALQFFCEVKADSVEVFRCLLQDPRFRQDESSYVSDLAQNYARSIISESQNFSEDIFWEIFSMARGSRRDSALHTFIYEFLYLTSKMDLYFLMSDIIKNVFLKESAIAACACFYWCATITSHPRKQKLIERARLVIKLVSRYFSDVSANGIKKEMKELYDRYECNFVHFHGNEEKYEIFVNWVLGVIFK